MPFLNFRAGSPFYGFVVACGDDARIMRVFKRFSKRLITYGFDSANDYQIRGQNSKFEILKDGKILTSLELRFPGQHFALNALAAFVVAVEVGIDQEIAVRGLTGFKGVDRRFQFRGDKSMSGQ